MTPPPPAPMPAAKPLLVVRNLVKAFPNGANVLNDVSLDVFAGDVFTVLGGSGCGKSTLLNILIGVDEPTSGTVHVLGQNISPLRKTWPYPFNSIIPRSRVTAIFSRTPCS